MSALAEEKGLVRQLIEDSELQDGIITIKGAKVANFGVCSYLGLNDDERLVQGAIEALRRFGTSYSSSITYTAVPLYRDLRERFEAIFGASAVIAGSTTLAHFAALPVMVRRGDLVIVDGQAHASILAATPTLQTNGAQVESVRHSDMERLEARLAAAEPSQQVWYLTDGVFSMIGDTAPAERLHGLLDKYPNFHIYCDDAHGFGWDGIHGKGNHLRRTGWHERLVVVVGLAKSFGTMGGVVALQDRDLAGAIQSNGGPIVFGGPIPPAILGASIASADIHLSDELPVLQSQLMAKMRLINRFSGEIGLPLAARDETPLWFLEVGPTKGAIELAARMRLSGFYLNASAFPVVPRGRAGVRFTVTNKNTTSQIEDMLVCLNEHRLEMFGETEVEIDLDTMGEPTPAADPMAEEPQGQS